MEDEEELKEMENKLKRQYHKQRGSGKTSRSILMPGAAKRSGGGVISSGSSVKSMGTIAKRDYRKRKKGSSGSTKF